MKANNVSAPRRVDLASKRNGLGNTAKEGALPHASADNESANPVGGVNQFVDNFDVRRLFQQNSRVKLSTKHRPTPSNTRTRRINGALVKVTELLTATGKTGRNARRFQSVPMWDGSIRQTVVRLPTPVAR